MTQSLSVTAASEPEPADESPVQYYAILACGQGPAPSASSTTDVGPQPQWCSDRTGSFQQLVVDAFPGPRMAFELAFAVGTRVVLALSPLGSYIQDDNQLSSPLTSYSRCKHFHLHRVFDLISIDLLYCTSVNQPPPPSTGGYLPISPRNRPILGRIIQTCTHAVRVRLPRAYSPELISHHSRHSHCPFLNYRPHVPDTSNAPVDII